MKSNLKRTVTHTARNASYHWGIGLGLFVACYPLALSIDGPRDLPSIQDK